MKLEQIGNNFSLFSDLENDSMVIMAKSKYLSFKKYIEELEAKVNSMQEELDSANEELNSANEALIEQDKACQEVEHKLIRAAAQQEILQKQLNDAWDKNSLVKAYIIMLKQAYYWAGRCDGSYGTFNVNPDTLDSASIDILNDPIVAKYSMKAIDEIIEQNP